MVAAASAKPPQQAEPASGAAHFNSKVEQTVYEKKLGLVPGEGSDNGGMVLRGTCANSVVRTPALAIPDNSSTFDQVTTVGDPLSNVKVQLNILHSWQGDVTVTLSHDASGTSITLVNRPGNPQTTFGFSTDNYGNNPSSIPFVLDDTAAQTYDTPATAVNNVTGSWLPDDPSFQTLSIFNGLTANTTWTLTVADGAGGDTGTLVRWAICSDNTIATGALEGAGSASPSSLASGQDTTIQVQVTPGLAPPSTGITVTADLSLLGGSSSQSLTDLGGNLFSYTHTVIAGPGIWNVPFTVSDLEGRMFSGSTTVTVVAGNDICETAQSLNIGDAVIGSNAGATNDPGLPTCSGLSTFNLGVWYTFQGNGNILNVTTCGPNTTLNTRVYVYTGTCGSFTCVGAATGTSPACSPSTAASAVFCSTMGQTYYVLVTNDTTGTGNFDFSV